MKRPRRIASSLSDSVQRELNMYALAASAAGVSLLTLAPQPAEAKIVYTKAHHVIGKEDHYNLDLNHDGHADFTFVNRYGCNTDWCADALSVNPTGNNGVEGQLGFASIRWACALPPGAHIGPRHPFSGQLMATTNVGALGSWVNVTNRYLGFRFKILGKTHYGWARLNVSIINVIVVGTLTGYAYETVPNKPIVAGKTRTANGPNGETCPTPRYAPAISERPQPASLGLLAMGSPALSIWRRKESVGAAQ